MAAPPPPLAGPTAFIFPGLVAGEGSAAALRADPAGIRILQQTFALAGEIDGPPGACDRHRLLTQLALGCWGWERFTRAGGQAAWLVAHSVGVYPALVAAGALSFAEAVAAVCAADGACRAHAPPGALLGLVGLTGEEVAALVAEVGGGLAVAADHGPRHRVVGGPAVAVEALGRRAREEGALSARLLPVERAYHTPHLTAAAAALAEALSAIDDRAPGIPILLGVGDPAAEIRACGWGPAVAGQLAAQVRWPPVARSLAEAGAKGLVEAGGGRSLARWAQRSLTSLSLSIPP